MDRLAEGAAFHRVPAGTSEALFLCEKTDELRDGADLADVVTPHRPPTSA